MILVLDFNCKILACAVCHVCAEIFSGGCNLGVWFPLSAVPYIAKDDILEMNECAT